MKTKELIKRIVHLSGPKIMALFVLTVPLGLLQGLLEISFGFSLLNFLSYYQLVALQPFAFDYLFRGHNPIVILLMVGLVRSGIAGTSQVINSVAYEGFFTVLRKKTVLQVLENPTQFRLSVAETSNLMSNLLSHSSAFVSNLAILTIQTFMTLIALVGLFKLSFPLSLVTILSGVIFGIPVLLTRKLFQTYSARIYADIRTFTSRLSKSIRNLEFLRIIDKTRDESAALVSINQSIFKNFLRYTVAYTTNTTWPQFGAVCMMIVVIVTNTRHHWLPAIVLIPYVYMLSRISAGISEIIRALGTIQFNYPFIIGLTELFPPELKWTASSAVSIAQKNNFSLETLKVENLAIGRGKNVYLDGISFQCGKGDFICFRGESGRGKTTLLMTLIGLLPGKGGLILWNGTSVVSLDEGWFKGRVAYSGADPFLLDTTIRNNVLIGNEHHNYSDSDIWKAFEIAKCTFAKELPGQLDYRLLEGGEGISAGQKQRLSIARALLRKPEILLLDEATANIDIETEESIIIDIRNQFPKLLVLAVSHRESMMKFATQQMVF